MKTQKTQFDKHVECIRSLRPYEIYKSTSDRPPVDLYEVDGVSIRIDYGKEVAVVHDIHATNVEDRRIVFSIPSKAFRDYADQLLKEAGSI